MASLAPGRTVPIALLYQAPALHQHLKHALSELGARVVYDTPAADFDRSALDRSGAEVVVINLDPDVDEEFEQLGDLLADEELKVIFNDGEVSSRLEGWDQARWARHLAAKILGVDDTNPPRPPGASAIPVKVRAAAPEYPGAPDVGGSFELHGHELERALSADTSEAISRTREALVTKEEPVAAQLVPRPEVKDASTLELPVGELVREIPQWQAEAPAPVAAIEPTPAPAQAPPSTAPPQVAAEFEAVLRDFGFLNESSAPATNGAAPVDDDFIELGVPVAEGSAAAPPDDDFADLGLSLEPLPASTDAVAHDELSFDEPAADVAAPAGDELSLESTPAASAADAPASDFDLDSFELEPFDESGSGSSFGQVQEASVPQGLDDFLFDLSLDEGEKERKQPAKPATAGATAPPKHPEAMRATPTVAGKVLSGERPDVESAPRVAPVEAKREPEAPAPAPAPAAPRKFDFSGLSLEPTEEELRAAPVTGRAKFRIDDAERAPVVVAPVPEPPPPPPAPVAEDDEFSLGALEFELDESTTVRPATIDRGEPADGEEPDLMAELEAVVGPPAPAAEAPADGPVRRVWVLGASIGGPEAVREFLGALDPSVPALFLLAQHMGADFIELMTQQLARATKLAVRNVVSGDVVRYGEVVVVPLTERIQVDAQGNVKLSALDGMSPYSPSIDQVLMDVADRFGANAGAIIFSGMAHDAIDGSVYLAQKGGKIWAQDPATCVISSMVDGARDAGVVTFTGSPAELARQFQLDIFRAG